MRRQDKYRNIEQANLMLENSYLKRKGLLKEEAENSVKFKITDRFYKDMNMSYSTLQPENDKSTAGERLNNNAWQLIGYSEDNNITSFYFAKFDKSEMQIDLKVINSNSKDGEGYEYLFKMSMDNNNARNFGKALDTLINSFKDLEVGKTDFYPSKFKSLEPGQIDDRNRFIVA
jgi:hypothetical protein